MRKNLSFVELDGVINFFVKSFILFEIGCVSFVNLILFGFSWILREFKYLCFIKVK